MGVFNLLRRVWEALRREFLSLWAQALKEDEEE